MAQWNAQGLGIMWITLLLDDPNEGPPTGAGAKAWKDQYGLFSVTVAADPSFSMVPGNSVGTPQFTLIQPRNMKVIWLQEGTDGISHHQKAEQMAHCNLNGNVDPACAQWL